MGRSPETSYQIRRQPGLEGGLERRPGRVLAAGERARKALAAGGDRRARHRRRRVTVDGHRRLATKAELSYRVRVQGLRPRANLRCPLPMLTEREYETPVETRGRRHAGHGRSVGTARVPSPSGRGWPRKRPDEGHSGRDSLPRSSGHGRSPSGHRVNFLPAGEEPDTRAAQGFADFPGSGRLNGRVQPNDSASSFLVLAVRPTEWR